MFQGMLATNIPPSIVTSGLMYHLDAGNPLSYPGSGSSVNDISGQGMGASTLYNSPAFTSAGTGSYLTFNGSSQYVFTTNLVSKFNSPSNSSVTLEMWTYSASDNGGLIVEEGSPSLDGGWYYTAQEIDAGTLNMRVWNVSSVNAGTYNRNTWNQTVLTYDGTTVRSYINNVAGATTTGTRQLPWANSYNLYYALMAPSATNLGDSTYLAGRWAIFRLYNRALTTTEISQNFYANRQRYSV